MLELKNIFYENEANFKAELARIFRENEYQINKNTEVVVNGFVGDGVVNPFLQFEIITDDVHLSTEFYCHDFGEERQVKIDELDFYDLNLEIARGFVLDKNELF